MSASKKAALVFGVSGGIGSNIYSNLKRKKFEKEGLVLKIRFFALITKR